MKIQLHISSERMNKQWCIPIEIPEFDHLDDALMKLDEPSRDAPAIAKIIFCTPQALIGRIKSKRSDLAELLSRYLADEILNFMSSDDTVMGYPKERNSNEPGKVSKGSR
jgi:hypothetical protein